MRGARRRRPGCVMCSLSLSRESRGFASRTRLRSWSWIWWRERGARRSGGECGCDGRWRFRRNRGECGARARERGVMPRRADRRESDGSRCAAHLGRLRASVRGRSGGARRGRRAVSAERGRRGGWGRVARARGGQEGVTGVSRTRCVRECECVCARGSRAALLWWRREPRGARPLFPRRRPLRHSAPRRAPDQGLAHATGGKSTLVCTAGVVFYRMITALRWIWGVPKKGTAGGGKKVMKIYVRAAGKIAGRARATTIAREKRPERGPPRKMPKSRAG